MGHTIGKRRKCHTPGQIVRKLEHADRLLGEGNTVADACRELGVTAQTYYRWWDHYGSMKAEDAKRLKEIEEQNATLNRLLA